MTAETIAAISGVLLSLAFSYVPGLKTWYENQTAQTKSLIMLAFLVVVSASAFGLACAGWFGVNITCDQAGIEQLVSAFVLALMANQSTYLVTRKLHRA